MLDVLTRNRVKSPVRQALAGSDRSKPFIESKVGRAVGSLKPGQGFSTRPIYVGFEFAVAVYPVGGTSRHRLPPPRGRSPARRRDHRGRS